MKISIDFALLAIATSTALLSPAPAQAIDIPAGLSDRALIDFLIPYYNRRTSRTLGRADVVLWDGHDNLDEQLEAMRLRATDRGAFAYTIPTLKNSNDRWSLDRAAAGGMQHCLIVLNVRGELLTGRSRQTILAHELYHCYQLQKIGWQAAHDSPMYLIEGGANYVGESTVGGTSTMGLNWWQHYLTEAQYLWQRTYDGFGFWYHLESKGLDPWVVMERALSDFSAGNTPEHLAHVFAGVNPFALASWPMSMARKPAWGDDWDAQGKDIPRDSEWPRKRTELLMDPHFTADLAFSMPQIITFETVLADPIRIRMENATGGFVVLGAEGQILYQAKLLPGEHRDLCASEYCGCPGGNDSLNLINVRGAHQIVFAGTGIAPNTNGQVIIEPAQAECCEGSTSLDPKLVGDWELDVQSLLNGWPHPPGETSRSATGGQTLHISGNGTYRKSTDVGIHTTAEFNGSITTFNYFATGGVSACLETKPHPANPKMFFYKLTHVNDAVQTNWIGVTGEVVTTGHYAGEEMLIAWGPRKDLQDPNSDQQAFGTWADETHFGARWARGPRIRMFNKSGPRSP
jgi:hypothetical protein